MSGEIWTKVYILVILNLERQSYKTKMWLITKPLFILKEQCFRGRGDSLGKKERMSDQRCIKKFRTV